MRALVVEGGGMRTAWTAGVLDSFAEAGYTDFDLHVGVSAGSILLVNQIAGQRGRAIRIMGDERFRNCFGKLGRFMKGGDMIDVDELWDISEQILTLEEERFFNQLEQMGSRLLVVMTDVETGKPHVVEPNPSNLKKTIQASSALPLMTKRPIEVDGIRALDGGISCPIPYEVALEQGADEVLVIRSRQRGYVKTGIGEKMIAKVYFRNNEPMKAALNSRSDLYNQQSNALIEDSRVTELCPSRPLESSRTCTDWSTLILDHVRGMEDGRAFLAKLRS